MRTKRTIDLYRMTGSGAEHTFRTVKGKCILTGKECSHDGFDCRECSIPSVTSLMDKVKWILNEED